MPTGMEHMSPRTRKICSKECIVTVRRARWVTRPCVTASHCALLLAALLLGAGLGPSSYAKTFTVDTLVDDALASDDDPGDGICRAGELGCTLRAAIEEANALPGPHVIEFSVSGTIVVGEETALAPSPGPLPAIRNGITIDGYTAPDYDAAGAGVPAPAIILDGSALDGVASGLMIRSDAVGTVIRGVAVVRFPGDGLAIEASDVLVQGSYFGIDAGGQAAPNGGSGVRLVGNGNTLGRALNDAGSSFTGRGNVISGNSGDGVAIFGDFNTLHGNLIGTDAAGEEAVGNGKVGVRVVGRSNRLGAPFNAAHDGVEEQGNVISANEDGGLLLAGDDNFVLSSLIGTDVTGKRSGELGNGRNGIVVRGSQNRIGSPFNATRNVVAGSQFVGILLGPSGSNADRSIVENNYIGLGSQGVTALGNGDEGVRIDNGTENEIVDNVIAGNGDNGLEMRANGFGNIVQGNLIGTNRAREDFGNGGFGILLKSDGNQVGGTAANEANIVGFSGEGGVSITGTGNALLGNFIGTDSGGRDLGNEGHGILVEGNRNTIGASLSRGGNVIGFNHEDGVHLIGRNNTVANNSVGINGSGVDVGNGANGVALTRGAKGNRVGCGYTSGGLGTVCLANTIAHNGENGVLLVGNATSENPIRKNAIHDNDALGIDLGGDGITENDEGDSDDGPNALQNYPEILTVESCDASGDSTSFEVTYTVASSAARSNYGSAGLNVDFYIADSASSGQGKYHLDMHFYPEPASETNLTLSTVQGTCADALVATATDADGNTSEFSAAAALRVNRPPVVDNPIDDVVLRVKDTTFTRELTTVFSDPDGDPLSFSASSSDDATVTASVDESTLVVSPNAAGNAIVSVTAEDPSGAAAMDDFSVTVEEVTPESARLDVTAGSNNPGEVTAQVGDENVVVLQTVLDVPSDSENVTVESVTISTNELERTMGTTASAGDIATVALYLDGDSDGQIGRMDTALGEATYIAGEAVTLSLEGAHTMVAGETVTYLVATEIAPAAAGAPVTVWWISALIPASLFGVVALRRSRRRLFGAALALLILVLSACQNDEVIPETKRFQFELTDVSATSSSSSQSVEITGLPVPGAVLTIE